MDELRISKGIARWTINMNTRGKISSDGGGWYTQSTKKPKPKEEEDEGFIKKEDFTV